MNAERPPLDVVLYGRPGRQLSELAKVLRPTRPRSTRVVSSSAELEGRLGDRGVDCVVFCLGSADDALWNDLGRLLDRLDHTGTAAVIALDEGAGADSLGPLPEGFDSVIEWPYEIDVLAAAIGRALDRRHPVQEPSSAPKAENDDEVVTIRRWGDPSDQPDAAPDDEPRLEPELAETDPHLEVRVWDRGSAERRPQGESTPPKPPKDRTGTHRDGESPEPHRSDLPPRDGGDLARHSPLRVVFGLYVQRASGDLSFEMDGIQRAVVFRDGLLGVDTSQPADAEQWRKVVDSLSWRRGRYAFQSHTVPGVKFRSLGRHPLEILHAAVHEGYSFNDVAQRLTPHFQHVPNVTELADEAWLDLGRLGGVHDLLGSCGQATLEQMVGRAGADVERALKNVLFCEVADLLCFRDQPMPARVPVEHVRIEEAVRPTDVAAPDSAEEAGDEGDDPLLERVAALAEAFQGKEPYELFGLRPGCGRDEVRTTYYRLVRQHHPDTYGLARSPQVKPLAEMVFRHVQKAYNKLLRSELHDTPYVASVDEVSRLSEQSTGAHEAIAPPTGPESEAIADEPTPEPAGPAKQPGLEWDEPTAPLPPEQRPGPTTTGVGPVSRRPVLSTPSGPLAAVLQSGLQPAMAVEEPEAGEHYSGPQPVAEPSSELSGDQNFRIGRNMLRARVPDKALLAFEKAVEGDPDNPTYLAHLAWASYLVDKSRVDEVLGELKTILADADEADAAALLLGKVYEAEGDAATAYRYFVQCLQLNPRNVEAQRYVRLYRMRKEQPSGLLKRFFSGRAKTDGGKAKAGPGKAVSKKKKTR